MARRPLTNPRKHATQERSRATVDALIEATARILVREGFDKASTNRIAEEAGVSVGSLYQYYPGKEALVAAVIDRHNQEIMQVVRGALAEVASQPIEKAVRRLVAVAIEAHRVDPKLHRVLAEQIPRTGRLDDHHPMNFSGMVAHKIICRLEKVLNTPRSFSLKSLEKQAAGAISR
jgi:AcrR family transcriptional regulator